MERLMKLLSRDVEDMLDLLSHEDRSVKEPIEMVYNADSESILKRAGEETNVSVTVLKREGQKYTPRSGIKFKLEKGKVFVRITKTGEEDLAKFWSRVTALESEKKQDLGNKFASS